MAPDIFIVNSTLTSGNGRISALDNFKAYQIAQQASTQDNDRLVVTFQCDKQHAAQILRQG